MEHSQANIDSLRCDHEEADSRMFGNVSYAMELYSAARVFIWNIVKLTLMPLLLIVKKQIRECFSMFHMPWNYIHQEELLYVTQSS